jgi:MFS family permease
MYQVGADAMLADIIPPEKRTDAYTINRIAHNAAFAIGPAIGGFLAATSYNLAFLGASSGFIIYGILLFFLARETLTHTTPPTDHEPVRTGGFRLVLQDKPFMTFVTLVSLGLIAPTMLWILMPVYAKTNFGIPENLYGWIPTTNALMCVFIQYFVTLITRKRPALTVVAGGMFIYALGAGSVALMSSFWGFWLSMVILTFGELALVPTASKYVADSSPASLRGRYMSIYWLGWGLARTLSPLIGGFLNDAIAPRAIWMGGLLIGLSSSLGLFLLSRLSLAQAARQTQPSA